MKLSELLKRNDVRAVIAIICLALVILLFVSLFKKDGFCRCNSIGSRVLCDEEHEKLKQLEGAL